MKTLLLTITILFSMSLLACGGKKDADKKSADPAPPAGQMTAEGAPSDAMAPGKPAPEPAVKKDAFVKPELEEKSLEKGGEAFKGWFAKGPKDTEVMQDLGGVRIASKMLGRPESFDLAWAFNKPDFAKMKENITKGAEMAKATVTFTVDTEEALEWTFEMANTKVYNFSLRFQVSEQDVNCYTMPSGESSLEKVAFMKETCKTIVKK